MKLNVLIFSLIGLGAFSCKPQNEIIELQYNFPEGTYFGILDIQGQNLPFEFILNTNPKSFTLKNGEEEFVIENITLTKDSIIVPLHIFDTKLKAVWIAEENIFLGTWTKNYVEDYMIEFTAKPTLEQNSNETKAIGFELLSSKYKVFFESMLEDSTVSIAEFTQDANDLKGTFLTTTGDYRYLRGSIYNNKLKLFTFDGEHAFVFTGKVDSNGPIDGHFYSGKTWHETWQAYPSNDVELVDASTLTYLKDSFEILSFSGKTPEGETFDLNNPTLANKAFVLQIMGSWCPNCMDETTYLSKWYNTQKPDGIELVSLAFERKDDFAYGKKQLTRLKDHYDIKYPLLFGGGSDKALAASKLPELNTIVAYPTLVFYNKDHKVTHIHTGFSGPGTGEHYERWKLDFEKRITEITQ